MWNVGSITSRSREEVLFSDRISVRVLREPKKLPVPGIEPGRPEISWYCFYAVPRRGLINFLTWRRTYLTVFLLTDRLKKTITNKVEITEQ